MIGICLTGYKLARSESILAFNYPRYKSTQNATAAFCTFDVKSNMHIDVVVAVILGHAKAICEPIIR